MFCQIRPSLACTCLTLFFVLFHLFSFPGFAKYFSEPTYSVEVVKAGRHNLVDLNKGDIALDLLRDVGGQPRDVPAAGQHKNRGEERLRKNRRKDREGTNDSDTKSDKDSVKSGKNPQKLDRKSAKDFVVGDYPVIESRVLKGSSAVVLVSHYNSWKELWVQDNEDKVIQFTKDLNLDTDKLGTTLSSVQVRYRFRDPDHDSAIIA